jgi:hypothetical protein
MSTAMTFEERLKNLNKEEMQKEHLRCHPLMFPDSGATKEHEEKILAVQDGLMGFARQIGCLNASATAKQCCMFTIRGTTCKAPRLGFTKFCRCHVTQLSQHIWSCEAYLTA